MQLIINKVKIVNLIGVAGSKPENAKWVEENLSPTQKKILNIFFYLGANFNRIYISQTKIANLIGCTRECVNRNIPVLIKHGMLKSQYRYRRTILYSLANIYREFYVLHGIKKIFTNVARFLILLTGLTATPIETGSHHIKEYKKRSLTHICYFNNCREECGCTYAISKSKSVSSEIINRLSQQLSLNADEISRLGKYSESFLKKAEYKLANTPNITNKTAFLFGVLKHISNPNNKFVTHNFSKPKEAPKAVKPPDKYVNPFGDVSHDTVSKSWDIDNVEKDAKLSAIRSNCSGSIADIVMGMIQMDIDRLKKSK